MMKAADKSALPEGSIITTRKCKLLRKVEALLQTIR